jgi:hypothetical protein
MWSPLPVSVACLALAALGVQEQAGPLEIYRVSPRQTDSKIGRFLEPHHVVFDRSQSGQRRLLLFLPGTGANPASVSEFVSEAARQGYRAVSLTYNNTPAVQAVCLKDPDPACSGKVRMKRTFGDNVTRRIDDYREESIVNRLTRLLEALHRDHPAEGWGRYLQGEAPRWENIAVAGHSQGAGMAALIAQKQAVARVILFSGPWDAYGRDRRIAPWIVEGHGATPAARWFAAFHVKEEAAGPIAQTLEAFSVPAGNIRKLSLEPARMFGENPYHLSVIGNGTMPRDGKGAPAYRDDWQFLLGTGAQ